MNPYKECGMKNYIMLLAMLLAVSVRGATVTFCERQDVSNDAIGSSVLVNGSGCVAGAVNGLEPVAVNGVLFAPVSPGKSITENGVTVSLVDLGNGRDFFDHDSMQISVRATRACELLHVKLVRLWLMPVRARCAHG